MYEESTGSLPTDQPDFDRFFGTQGGGRACTHFAIDRNRFVHDLYLRQLKEAGGAR